MTTKKVDDNLKLKIKNRISVLQHELEEITETKNKCDLVHDKKEIKHWTKREDEIKGAISEMEDLIK